MTEVASEAMKDTKQKSNNQKDICHHDRIDIFKITRPVTLV